MLVLHDPDCLLHETIELLGSKAIPALESPARLHSILASLENSNHTIRKIEFSSVADAEKDALYKTISQSHDENYLHHLQTAFSEWRAQDLVESDGTILPECWRFPTSIKDYNVKPQPPKDIYARTGYYSFDMSSGITASTWKSTIASANLAYQGVQMLFPPTISNTTTTTTTPTSPSTILALCRPPGHHCDGHRSGGYCYVNNAAVAISAYQSLFFSPSQSQSQSQRIAVLDLDFHHGNGTQELYYASSQVLYISIHGQDEFPYYTGHASETGIDAGQGFTLNLPLPSGSSIEAYLEQLDVAMLRLRQFDPGFVLVSLGFDTYETDPLGKFGIATADYETVARRVRRGLSLRRGRRGGKLRGEGQGQKEDKKEEEEEEEEDGQKMDDGWVKSLVVLEGGYVIEKLGENVLSWLKGWEDGEIQAAEGG